MIKENLISTINTKASTEDKSKYSSNSPEHINYNTKLSSHNSSVFLKLAKNQKNLVCSLLLFNRQYNIKKEGLVTDEGGIANYAFGSANANANANGNANANANANKGVANNGAIGANGANEKKTKDQVLLPIKDQLNKKSDFNTDSYFLETYLTNLQEAKKVLEGSVMSSSSLFNYSFDLSFYLRGAKQNNNASEITKKTSSLSSTLFSSSLTQSLSPTKTSPSKTMIKEKSNLNLKSNKDINKLPLKLAELVNILSITSKLLLIAKLTKSSNITPEWNEYDKSIKEKIVSNDLLLSSYYNNILRQQGVSHLRDVNVNIDINNNNNINKINKQKSEDKLHNNKKNFSTVSSNSKGLLTTAPAKSNHILSKTETATISSSLFVDNKEKKLINKKFSILLSFYLKKRKRYKKIKNKSKGKEKNNNNNKKNKLSLLFVRRQKAKLIKYIKNLSKFDPALAKSQQLVYNFVPNKNKPIQLNSFLVSSFFKLDSIISKPVYEITPKNTTINLFFYFCQNDLKFYFRKFLKKNKIRFRFSKKEFYKKFKAILKNSKTLKNYFFKYYFFTKKDAIIFISNYLRKKNNDIKIKKGIVNLIKKTKIKKMNKKWIEKLVNNINKQEIKTYFGSISEYLSKEILLVSPSMRENKNQNKNITNTNNNGKKILFDLTALKKSGLESQISAVTIGLIANNPQSPRRIKFRNVAYSFFRLTKLSNVRRIKQMLNKTKRSKTIFSVLSGMNIKKGGRLFSERIIPKRTSMSFQKGKLNRNTTSFVTTNRFTSKSRRGAFSITVTMGHKFF